MRTSIYDKIMLMGDFNLTVENKNLKVFMSTFDSECLIKKLHVFNLVTLPPSKHFLFTKMSSRRLEDVFNVTLFVFQDVLKTYLQDGFQDVFKTSLRRLQDVFARRLAIMSSRRLQYVFTKTNVCCIRQV